MKYDFDRPVARRGTGSVKWQRYGREVLPLWVADMDFVSAEPIVEALHRRVDERVFGYTEPAAGLRAVIRERLKERYDWEVGDHELLFVPGIVTGINLASRVYAECGEAVLVQQPVYSHFFTDPAAQGRVVENAPLVAHGDTYEIDFDAFEASITERTRLFILCNPHNPVGRVYTRAELARLAEICLRHRLVICSDEIHCDLLYPGHRHIPIATLGDEIARRTITLMAPSKTYNLAGLGCSFAVIPDGELRRAWAKGASGIIPFVNVMGLTAALAAYRDGQEWLDQVLSYLRGNRDFLADSVAARLPGVRMTRMEATYLAWLDCRDAGISGEPFDFFLKEAGVALNPGTEYGAGGEGFVRLNFGCPRSVLAEAIDRMAEALKSA
jgi:cystathionine beta-lyase